MIPKSNYLPVAEEEDEQEHPLLHKFSSKKLLDGSRWREAVLLLIVVVETFSLCWLALRRPQIVSSSTSFQCETLKAHAYGQTLYSPAQEALQSEVKTFTVGRPTYGDGLTAYQGVGKEADRAWGELYNHTVFKIPHSQAVLLPNKTYPISHEPGYYLAELDVFHQLHCLNYLRMFFNIELYRDHPDMGMDHTWHCIDSIRQSLMCSADISVNVWQWDDKIEKVVGHSDIIHSCRNFDKVRDWALDRRIHKWIDGTYIENDLPDIPVIYS
ncbi:hypothetical protein BDP27DRAFT_1298076 [Rhodocollybia butyracea]|uniref:Tat pathway signal sequence n=1 Tax=Rhodocollybia butyracea TaxID=206335 RepID=A0A9P5PKL2_9AGAR|nr:hypothetical protein BDP27DRAFT_1298076 [Rhodocollybia butyracea]